jgi:hypothetical protein
MSGDEVEGQWEQLGGKLGARRQATGRDFEIRSTRVHQST